MLKSLTIFSSLIILASSQQRGYASEKTFDIFVYQGQYLNRQSNAQYNQSPRTSRGNNYGYNRNNNGFYATNPFMNFQQGRMFSSPQYHQPFRHMAPPPSYYYEPRPPYGKPPNHHHYPHHHHPHTAPPHHNHMATWPNNGFNNNYYNTECYDTTTNQAPNFPSKPTSLNNGDKNVANVDEENPSQISSTSNAPPIPVPAPSSVDDKNPSTTASLNNIISGVFPNFDQSVGSSKPPTTSIPSGPNVNELISGVFPGLNTNNFGTTTTPGSTAINDLLSGVFPSLGQNGQINNNNPFRPTPLPNNGLISGVVSDLGRQPPTNPSISFNSMTSSIPVFQPTPRPVNDLISGVFPGLTQQEDLPPPPTDPSVPFNSMTSSIPVFQPEPIPNKQETTTPSIPVFQPGPVTATTTDSGNILIPPGTDDDNDSLLYDIDIRLGVIEEQPKKSNQNAQQ